MDDILGDIIEGVLEIIIEGLFGSKKNYRSSYKKPSNLRNDYTSYHSQSRNLDGSLYKTKKPKPMYGPGSVQEEKESLYKKKSNTVSSAYMGATIAKKASTVKTEPIKATEPKPDVKEVKPNIETKPVVE